MKKKVAIIGAGGFGREVLDIFEAEKESTFEVLGFIVEPQFGSAGTIINDKPILGGFDWLERHASDVYVICGVGPSHHRKRLIELAQGVGARFCTIIHPSAILTRWVTIGTGVVITAGCVLTNQIKIGNHVHINLDCTVGHDVVINDYVTLSPGVHVSGNVTLGEGCLVGTGANIIEKLWLGEWSIIGAGSTIVKDVPANSTVVGIPGKVIKQREPGWPSHYNP
jgi:sugar O-acyltransferase (sialic acid O-acetyltransferase NeuD family)